MNQKTLVPIIIVVLIILGGFLYINYVSSPTMSPIVEPIPTSPDSVSTTNNADPSASQKEFTVTGKNFSFDPNEIRVKKDDEIVINFVNGGGFHDFRIDEFNVATKQLQSGGEETVTFVADKAGSFQYYCSVGNHRAMGMWGTLVVE